MTDLTAFGAPAAKGQPKSLLNLDERTRKRNAAEARFRLIGKAAVAFGIIALVGLLASILSNGLSSFQQTYITIDVYLDPAKLDPSGTGDRAAIAKVSTFGYTPLIEKALGDAIAAKGLASEGLTPKTVGELISKDGPANLRNYVLADPSVIGKTVSFDLLAAGRIDGYYKGRVTMESAKLDRNVSPEQLVLADTLKQAGILVTKFNWAFFTAPDASDTRPEAAGLGIAVIGSAYMMLIVLVLSLPIGVATSIYLEEFAPQNWFTDLIEVNIANLAAVPSIVFGILGLAVLINFIGLPQSAPVVGGLVLTLMTLPTIIIATRSALKAVPPSIRDAALGVGASKMQSIFHHVLPLAMPGILTGAIIGLARALGETAPLLLIGMVAFVKEFPSGPPDGFFQPASALPVQVYNWTQRGDPAFVERASGAIIVLLVFLILMNLVAIILRRRFERRW
ncbi:MULTISPECIES: phosphate ABC transporter permease PstA [Rhizobium]|uniref:Phosphate transport system permease protein PstA n=1 Tax=Rhizobium wuzhouense TaxID=1986026 RepID=A0ABX5NXQ5_9HYPH|nr:MULTISPECIES: phosphate ABC transporter permease PstA [Rhizobium]PYB77661.1 phosphate ABC transporter permease PtsA [Rhizobium wuzhouense]RKE86350.1 phosphate ABC transporter membrane protein 2 (PhoT family) [Rhizobium sp. AG855]